MSQSASPVGRKRLGVLGAVCALLILAGAATLSARFGGSAQEQKPNDANLPVADVETYRPRNMTLEQIRRIGSIQEPLPEVCGWFWYKRFKLSPADA